MKQSRITNVWVNVDKATENDKNFVNITIFREDRRGSDSRTYNCHSGNDKERRNRFWWRALRLQAAYFDKGG